MTYRPILFATPLVRAILDGRKTETRRLVKPQPDDRCTSPGYYQHATGTGCPAWVWYTAGANVRNVWRCPYGAPGDVLWVRETWKPFMEAWRCGVEYKTGAPESGAFVDRDVLVDLSKRSGIDLRFPGAPEEYHNPRWRPSIHMPKWAARIFLRVDEVRVERLQDIDECAARAEGVPPAWLDVDGEHVNWAGKPTYRQGFARLWGGLAKPGTRWEDNPWVWVVRFHRIDRPEGWPEVTP